MLIPWFEPEITPPVLTPRVHRYRLSPDDAAGNVRGVIEAQMKALIYRRLLPLYAACEAQALGRGPDPTGVLEKCRHDW